MILVKRLRTLTKSLQSFGAIVILIILVIGVTIAQPGFVAFGNLMNILSQWAPVGIMGIGMTYVVIAGGFDLAVGATYALTAVTAATVGQHYPPLVAFAAAIAVGLVVGAANGVIVTWLRVNPFIATLGSSLAISGITLVLTGNAAVVVNNASFGVLGADRWAGIPYSGILVVVLFVVFGLVLTYTPFGQAIFAVGGNVTASRLAGIRTKKITSSSYVISGMCAGVAGCITSSQLSSAQATVDPNLVFNVLTIVILGGTALGGGRGAIWRTAIGTGILATLQNGFNLLNINPYYQDIIQGAVIVAASSSIDWSRLSRRSSAEERTVSGGGGEGHDNSVNRGEENAIASIN